MANENRAYFYAVGRRKTARATVRLFPSGTGDVIVNNKAVREWADTEKMLKTVIEPLAILGMKKDYDLVIRTSGGGKIAQAEAARLGVARALIKKQADARPQLKDEGMLTRDPRVKERKKPGLKKARRAPQFSKR